jgi:opacity protein-like surface antigen
MKIRALSLIVLALAAAPSVARAQFGLERVLSYISVANVNTQMSCLISSDVVTAPGGNKCGLRGFGVEVGLDLTKDTAKYLAQFALGYGQIQGIRAKNKAIDMHGVMRLLPEVSLYLTRNTKNWAMPYLGVHSGIVTLSNWQVYTTPGDTLYRFSASTLQFGATAGLSLPRSMYIDVGYRYRSFQSLEWALPRGVLPPGWPKTVKMSALQATAGVQFDAGAFLGRAKK